MRIIFAGTPIFAVHILKSLLDAKYDICAVYTKPDRHTGRGRKLTASPVKQFALECQIPVQQFPNFKIDNARRILANYQADLMIVVAYGLVLPQAVLEIPKLGCINIHASLLPRWRGAAPIQRAILAGDHETGVAIMQMEARLDTGPILAQARCPINHYTTAQSLHNSLASLGAKILLEALPNIVTLQTHAKPQNDSLSCYADKLQKREAVIDWQQPATITIRQIKAFNSWPIARTIWQDRVLKIWSAKMLKINHSVTAGDVIAVSRSGIDIATGDQVLRITEIQLSGKRPISVSNFINANYISIGEHLG